jgi:hypothetical protein
MTPRHDYQVGRNLTHDEATILVHLICVAHRIVTASRRAPVYGKRPAASTTSTPHAMLDETNKAYKKNFLRLRRDK